MIRRILLLNRTGLGYSNDNLLVLIETLSWQRISKILNDFTDGNVIKDNKFFQQNPSAFQLILYQDAFETVNPLNMLNMLNINMNCWPFIWALEIFQTE